jgi:uncharacterized protein YggU (UPF0235/DUF167 family)
LLTLARRGDRLHFSVRVTPRASANSVGGERDGALIVRVTAAPAEGAANDAVVRLVARALGIAPSALRIERGATSRTKVLSVPVATEGAVLRLAK